MRLLMRFLLVAIASVLAEAKQDTVPIAIDERFSFIPTPQNWTEASKVCHQNDAHLAYPNNQQEANDMWVLMIKNEVDQVHLGMHDQYTEGKFVTATGKLVSQMSFNQWAPEGDTGGPTMNCGSFVFEGLMNVECSSFLPAICERDLTPAENGFKDYVHIPGHGYYKRFPTQMSWEEGLDACATDGAHMLILNSEEEVTAVFNTFNPGVEIPATFVGVHHYHADKYFVTIFDDPLESTGFSRWQQSGSSGSNSKYPLVVMDEDGLKIVGESWTTQIICELGVV